MAQISFSQQLTCRQFLEQNNFNTSRSYSDYARMLTPIDHNLKIRVANLRKNSFVIDMGAGEALALKQMVMTHEHISKAIAVGYKIPENFRPPNVDSSRFEYLEGDLLDLQELDAYRGRIDLITDVYGPLSYIEKDFQKVLEKYLELLKIGGRLFFVLREESNLILSADYPRSNWIQFFKSIKGIEIRNHSKSNNGEIYTSFEIIKTQEEVEFGSLLIEKKYEASAPPKRIFHWHRKHP